MKGVRGDEEGVVVGCGVVVCVGGDLDGGFRGGCLLSGDAGMVDDFAWGDGSDFLGCSFGELWEI